MTAPIAPEIATLAQVWQEFIDARFPNGWRASAVGSNGLLTDPIWHCAAPTVVGLRTGSDGDVWPVVRGYRFTGDRDFWINVDSWSERSDVDHYAVRVSQPEDRTWELAANVADSVAEAMADHRADEREWLSEQARMAARGALAEQLGRDPSAAEVRATIVTVEPYTRVVDGEVQHVEGYSYDRETGERVPDAVARSREASLPGRRVGRYQQPSPEADIPPLSDEDVELRRRFVRRALDDAIERGLKTTDLHATEDAFGGLQWSADRAVQQRAVAQEFLRWAEDVPRERRAVISGGLPGSGKTTTLVDNYVVDPPDYMMLNPDEIKEEMARRGMVPRVEGLTPLEASTLVHYESGYIADMIAEQAMAEGRNLIWDVTMSNARVVQERLAELDDFGYEDVAGVLVRTDVETAVRRQQERWRTGVDAWNAGTEGSLGGRFVPLEVTTNQVREGRAQSEDVFQSLLQRFGRAWLFDNSEEGRRARLVETYGLAE